MVAGAVFQSTSKCLTKCAMSARVSSVCRGVGGVFFQDVCLAFTVGLMVRPAQVFWYGDLIEEILVPSQFPFLIVATWRERRFLACALPHFCHRHYRPLGILETLEFFSYFGRSVASFGSLSSKIRRSLILMTLAWSSM